MIKEKHGGYIYGIDHEVYDFSANLNPLGMPKEANRAIIENIEKYESYPDPHYAELKAAIATYHGIDSDRIAAVTVQRISYSGYRWRLNRKKRW